jgi:hypothetical protein
VTAYVRLGQLQTTGCVCCYQRRTNTGHSAFHPEPTSSAGTKRQILATCPLTCGCGAPPAARAWSASDLR